MSGSADWHQATESTHSPENWLLNATIGENIIWLM